MKRWFFVKAEAFTRDETTCLLVTVSEASAIDCAYRWECVGFDVKRGEGEFETFESALEFARGL